MWRSLVTRMPHPPAVRIGRAAALDAVVVGDEARLVEAEPGIEALVVEEEQAGHAARVDLDVRLEPVGLVAGDAAAAASESDGALPRAFRTQPSVSHPDARRARRARARRRSTCVPSASGREIVATAACRAAPARPPCGLAKRLRQVAAGHPEPAVRGPLDRVEQGLAAERPIAVLIAVIDASTSRRPGPRPGWRGRATTISRAASVVRTSGLRGSILPRAVDRARARGDHHVAGRRAGGAADRGDQVEIAAAADDLRALRARSPRPPSPRDSATDRRHARRLADPRRGRRRTSRTRSPPERNSQREPSSPTAWPGIDMVGQLEVDRVAPRPLDPVGPDDVDGVRATP